MSEDYLWDKIGGDREIEKLESVLAAFRYQETDAPALPAISVVPVSAKAPWWRLSLAFAAFAVIAVLVGVSFQAFRNGMVSDKTALNAPVQIIEQSSPPANITPYTSPETVENLKPVKPYRVSIRRSAPSLNRRNGTIAKTFESKKGTVALTDEEKYAYNQLMLALSITGSKLKLVRDTIDQIETGKSANAPNDR
jgi:hypothetical protein